MVDKATNTKFIIVLIVGIVIMSILVTSVFSGKKKNTSFDEFGYTEATNEDTALEVAVQEETIEEEIVLPSIDESIEETEETQTDAIDGFEIEYETKYGNESMNQAKEAAKKVVTFWLEEETDKTKWEPYTTSSFLNEIFTNFQPSGDGITRKVKQMTVHSVSPDEENEIKFEVIATWGLINDENEMNEQTRLFYVSLSISETNNWLVKELVQL